MTAIHGLNPFRSSPKKTPLKVISFSYGHDKAQRNYVKDRIPQRNDNLGHFGKTVYTLTVILDSIGYGLLILSDRIRYRQISRYESEHAQTDNHQSGNLVRP